MSSENPFLLQQINTIMQKITFSFLTITCLVLISATKPSPGYKVGDTVENFSLKNIDGSMLDLSTYLKKMEAKGAVVVFTCNTCPYAVATEDRLVSFDKKYSAMGYPLIAVNPNVPYTEKESFESMQLRAKEKSFSFPYLADETQDVARAFGAKKTPHVFLLQIEEEVLKLRYVGAFDDNPMKSEKVKQAHTEIALEELIAEKPISKPKVKAIGCTVKWVN